MTTASCDSNVGLPETSTDSNGTQTIYSYDSNLRPAGATFMSGGVMVGGYSIKTTLPTIKTTVMATPSASEVSITTLDGLGRVSTTVDPGGATVTTSYDVQGRTYTTTNPKAGVTTFYYDFLNRPTFQQQPDHSFLQWCYDNVAPSTVPNGAKIACSKQLGSTNSGTWVTYSDENGNQWQQTSDALGRLTAVLEPNGTASTPALETDYTYDLLNNLLTVNQFGNSSAGEVSRTRSFTYDSLSEPLCASNPENSTATCPTAEPATGPAGLPSGTVRFTYDNDGNLLTKKDAGGRAITYSYDGLNRLLSKSYSDGTTPYSCYQYDASTTAKSTGRLSAEWTAPGSGSNSAGCTATAFITKRTVQAYDALGRILSEQQCTHNASGPGSCTASSSNPFALSYVYDLAGHPTAYTNGVNNVPGVGSITFGLQYDAAGRLQNLNSSWNPAANSAGSLLPLFTADPTNGYTSFNAIQNVILGNNIVVNKTYDNRLRTTGQTVTHP